jgi:hypothetical protein
MRHAEVLTTQCPQHKPSARVLYHIKMDPFRLAQPVEEVEFAAPAPTTFDAPSAAAGALVGAQPEWESKCCTISVRVPVGGETVIKSETIQNALCAAMGEEPSAVIHPTGFHIVGAQSHNPSGVPVGIDISGTTKTAVHIGEDASVQAFSGIMANRFHPIGDTSAPLVGVKVDPEAKAQRVAVAQKWAGVQAKDLLRGVQQMTSAKVGTDSNPVTQFAVPIAIPVGEGEDQTMVQQPLAWCIERNMAQLGDQVTMGAMPSSNGQMVDHFFIGQEAMESIVGATTQNVFGAQSLEDVTISAKALEPYTGSDCVTIGLRVDADLLNFYKQ